MRAERAVANTRSHTIMTEAAGPWIKLIVLASQLHKRLYIRAATAYTQRREAHRSRIITLYYYYYYVHH